MTVRSVIRRIAGAASAAPATVALVLTLLLVHAFTGTDRQAFDTMVHSDHGLASGEVWRLISAHLIHLDPGHLIPNVVGLVALGLPLERRIGTGPILALALVSSGAISLGVVMDPSVDRYCGLSGVLNTFFAALCLTGIARGPRLFWTVLLTAGLAKIAWEMGHPPLMQSGLSWPPHVISHLVGYLVGAMGGAMLIGAQAPTPGHRQPRHPDPQGHGHATVNR
ncbi:rhombosortase [Jannaschia aquimarina]|uniref:GlpG_1 protein n=1 Tax=Jannaschia aquimarina TaxID=935700 RepID=A0A0D1EHA2_9RHOB|nr:rhombosortase [Jannaschia aquimarina]KIT17054.1 Rhomboid protease GlpG [Jannaschia aquimarina]SNS82387.1 rhomboid family GlyGly-CTERM serine protease [Jannaschia aquimarina]